MWVIIGEVFFFFSVGVLLLGGLILTFVNLPGAWLIWAGILLTGIVKGFDVVPVWFVILTFFFAIIITLIDNFVIPLAAKKYGGGKWGMLGGLLGAFFGFLLLNLPGLFIGPLFGAFILEYLVAKKGKEEAFKAGIGSFLGVIATIVLRVMICFAMIIIFLIIWIF